MVAADAADAAAHRRRGDGRSFPWHDRPGGATARLTIAHRAPGTGGPLRSTEAAPTFSLAFARTDPATHRGKPGASATDQWTGRPGRRGRSTSPGEPSPRSRAE